MAVDPFDNSGEGVGLEVEGFTVGVDRRRQNCCEALSTLWFSIVAQRAVRSGLV